MRRVFRLSRGPEGARRDVQAEIEHHLELRTREFKEAGMTEEEARRAALAAFGDPSAVEAEVRGLRQRTVTDRRRRDFFSGLGQDTALAFRGLRRSPGFAAVALITLMLGIGANTALFSVVRSVLLRPLPYPDSDRLVQLWTDHRSRGRTEPEWLSPAEFRDWREQNRSFASMGAYSGWAPDLLAGDAAETLQGQAVSAGFFETLGVRPARGRTFSPEDDVRGAPWVVVLSDGLWRRRFGADPNIVGRSITLTSEPWTVIGVMPRDFRPPLASDLWRPLEGALSPTCRHGCIVLRAIGRVKEGISLAAAESDLESVAARIAKEYPGSNEGVGVWLVPLHEQVTGPVRQGLFALLGAVACVLLIACVNLANLLLVRGSGRARELSVRAALGAGRRRILRQLMTESLALALVGGVLGLLAGLWATDVLAALVPEQISLVQAIRLDGIAVLFALGLSVGAGLLFGLLPAIRVARPKLADALRTGGRDASPTGGRLRAGLVIGELALAVMLLIGAGLMMRSFLKLQQVDLGYRSGGVQLAPLGLPRVRYPEPLRAADGFEQILQRLRANPAVRAAELTGVAPLDGGDNDVDVLPLGGPATAQGREPTVWYRPVTSGYLQTMGMRLAAGRWLAESDREGQPPVGILNQEAAQTFWPGQDAVGRLLQSGERQVQIVGVVASGRHDGANQPLKPELFFPLRQFPARFLTLILEPVRAAEPLDPVLREALRATDPLVPPPLLERIEVRLADSVALPRLYLTLFGVFALAAVVLAVIGVYGVMTFTVAQRQRELGIRVALGAGPADLRRLVVGQGARLALLGVAAGVAGAIALNRVVRLLLFEVSSTDGATYVAVAALLASVTLLASLLPARRASRVDPLTALRED